MSIVARSLCIASLVLSACGGGDDADADPWTRLLSSYEAESLPAWNRWKHAAWRAHTQVVDGDPRRAREAAVAQADWLRTAANSRWARQARELTVAASADGGTTDAATPTQLAAVEAIRRLARQHPSTEQDLLDERDRFAGAHLRLRFRTLPALDGAPIDPGELADLYTRATDVQERETLWDARMAAGARLKGSFLALRDTRNQVARKGGWTDHLSREIDPYGLDVDRLKTDLKAWSDAITPLYSALHTWARYEMATRVGLEPPAELPVHWLPSPLARDWSELVALEGESLASTLTTRGAPAMLRDVDALYTDIGLAPLPDTFWERSSLYPADPSSGLGKTTAPSAWDMNLAGDVRVLMAATADEPSWRAAIREFGFAHTALARHAANLPSPVRQFEPRALQGAVAAWADIIATRPDRLMAAGLAEAPRRDEPALMKEALAVIPWLQIYTQVIVPLEIELYSGELPDTQLNVAFWTRMRRGMGIAPPRARGERYADALNIPSLHDLPGRTLDPLLATLIAYHAHVTTAEATGLDPYTGDLVGQQRVAQAMQILATAEGMSDWRMAVQNATGAPLSAESVTRYFQPLRAWLDTQNAGRENTFGPR